MDKPIQKQQPKVPTDPAIKTDKKNENEIADNELNQVTGGSAQGGWDVTTNKKV